MAKRTEEQWEVYKFAYEADFQSYVMRRLKELPNAKFIKIADKFTSGISDIIGCMSGKFLAIELKVGSNKPTPLQLDFIRQVQEAGGVGGVAWTWFDVKNILRTAFPDSDVW